MKKYLVILALFVSCPAFAHVSPYVVAVRKRCHGTAEALVRSRMTRFQNLWANFFSENLAQRPSYLRVYAKCMIDTAERNYLAANKRQKFNESNMIPNIKSRKASFKIIAEISGKSTVCGLNPNRPGKIKLLREGATYIGRLPNDKRFDWYWGAIESFLQDTRNDLTTAFGFCRIDPL